MEVFVGSEFVIVVVVVLVCWNRGSGEKFWRCFYVVCSFWFYGVCFRFYVNVVRFCRYCFFGIEEYFLFEWRLELSGDFVGVFFGVCVVCVENFVVVKKCWFFVVSVVEMVSVFVVEVILGVFVGVLRWCWVGCGVMVCGCEGCSGVGIFVWVIVGILLWCVGGCSCRGNDFCCSINVIFGVVFWLE